MNELIRFEYQLNDKLFLFIIKNGACLVGFSTPAIILTN